MRSFTLFLTALPILASAEEAPRYAFLADRALVPRQGSNAFVPGIGGFTSKCPEDRICGSTCLRPERGEECCIENYGCTPRSFCLTKGYCCPDGDDPATCARENGVTLPPGFIPGQTRKPGSSGSSGSSTAGSSAPPASASKPPAPPSSSEASATVPTLTTSIPPVVAPTANASVPTGTPTVGPPVVPFTGGAGTVGVNVAGVLAVGAMGLTACLL